MNTDTEEYTYWISDRTLNDYHVSPEAGMLGDGHHAETPYYRHPVTVTYPKKVEPPFVPKAGDYIRATNSEGFRRYEPILVLAAHEGHLWGVDHDGDCFDNEGSHDVEFELAVNESPTALQVAIYPSST